MSHYDEVVTALSMGQLVPFLGAGVNLFGRKEQEQYTPGTYLPSGRELSEYLAGIFTFRQRIDRTCSGYRNTQR